MMAAEQRAIVRAQREIEASERPMPPLFREIAGHISGVLKSRDGGIASVERDVLACGHEVSAAASDLRFRRCFECEPRR